MARRKRLCDVCGDEDELHWRRHRLIVEWVSQEWAMWRQETGQQMTQASDEFRKRLHELVDAILDADDDLMRADEAMRAARKAAKVVPLRGNGGAA